MNLPNKLTVLRMLLVPLCVWLVLSSSIPFNYLLTLVVFAIASITDALDGSIARRRKLITDFGKFMDPLADKILVCSLLICFVWLRIVPVVAVLLIIFREFAVSGLRLVAATNGTVVAANMWGKVKTVSQMIAIIVTLIISQIELSYSFSFIPIVRSTLMWVAAALTIISGIVYFIRNIDCIKDF